MVDEPKKLAETTVRGGAKRTNIKTDEVLFNSGIEGDLYLFKCPDPECDKTHVGLQVPVEEDEELHLSFELNELPQKYNELVEQKNKNEQ